MSQGPVALAAYVLYRMLVIPPLAYHAIKQRAWTLPAWRP